MKNICTTFLFFLFGSVVYSQEFLDSVAALKESAIKEITYRDVGPYQSYDGDLEPIIIDGLEIAYARYKKVDENNVARFDESRSYPYLPSIFTFFQGKLDSAALFFNSKCPISIEVELSKSRNGSHLDSLRWRNYKYTISYHDGLTELDFVNKIVSNKREAYDKIHEHDSDGRRGKGNSSFMPDLVHCMQILQQPTTVKSFEALLPSFVENDVPGVSYAYQFSYKGADISLVAFLNTSTKTIHWFTVGFSGKSGFDIFDIQTQMKKYGFEYNIKANSVKRNYLPGECRSCTYYKNAKGNFLEIYPSGDFEVYK